MKTRRLGRVDGGLEVSELGLGCMGMSEFYGARDDEASTKVLRRAVDLGVTFFDTADMYGHGHNEELLGRMLRDQKTDSLVVATKFGIVRDRPGYARGINNAADYAVAACEASLRRLAVSAIDLLYIHRVEKDRPIEEVMGALSGLVAAGKVRHIGLCEVNSTTLRRAHAVHPIAAVQSEFSIWSREPELDVLATCQDLGIGFVPYAPLGRGFLTGKIDSISEFDADDFRRRDPRFEAGNISENLRIAVAVAQFAKDRGFSAAQIALAWLLDIAPNVVPIPGTKREDFLIENCAATKVELTQCDKLELDQLVRKFTALGDRYSKEGMKGING